MAHRYWSYFLYNTNIPNRCGKKKQKKKSTGSIVGGKNWSHLWCGGSDKHRAALSQILRPNHWFYFQDEGLGISNVQGWTILSGPRFITSKVEPCHFSPPSTTWRFTFLAWVLGDLPVSVNKWEWGLFKEPLRCHLTFPDIQHLENLIIPCTFSAKDVRIDSMYLWGGGFYTGFDLHLVLFYLTTTTLSNFIHYFAQMDWLYYRGLGMGMTNLCNTRA